MIKHLTQDQINLVPSSEWYAYTMECGHTVYTKIRIACVHSYNEHFIRCPKCQSIHKDKFNWSPVVHMEAVPTATVDRITDGYSYIMGDRILRTDGTAKNGAIIPAGNPLPYKAGVNA